MSVDEALAAVRTLLRTRSVFDELLSRAVLEACEAGATVTAIARVLGVHRATFYRQFPLVTVASGDAGGAAAGGRQLAAVVGEDPGQAHSATG